MDLDGKQALAVEMCVSTDLRNRIVAVTGSAGTGKTTIIKMVAEQLIAQGHSVIACAPTGKAARRIKEATGIEAVTIHRLLEFPRPHERDPKTGKALDPKLPRRHKGSPINYQYVLCDEYAMVNHELNRQLIDALPLGGFLRCFGDINQLPPIEDEKRMEFFNNKTPFMSHLEMFPSVTLDRIYRQTEGSGIFMNAAAIMLGNSPKPLEDFYIKFTSMPTRAVEEHAYAEAAKYRRIENQIIVTGNKGWIGTYQLNLRVQGLINPDPRDSFDPPRDKWMEDQPVTLGIGDKVVVLENCYDLRDYYERFARYDERTGEPDYSSFIPTPDTKMMLNGEIGILTDITYNADKTVLNVYVDFGDRVVEVPFVIHEWSPKNNSIFQMNPVKKLTLGYVLTTHKCQGSEFQEVVYVLNKSSKWTQSRKNLYTAVTRARKKVTMITDQGSLIHSVRKVA